jgi:UDP-2,4-diacetamido-2,4,6-trideoxy-beta-L-altropyranose hydrolase
MISQNRCVGIRLDFSAEIGLGHLTRCVALADYFSYKGVKVIFIVRTIAPKIETWLGRYELFSLDSFVDSPVLTWSQEIDAELSLKVLLQFNNVDWVIVDSYSLDLKWEKLLRSKFKLAVIEDFRNRYHSADVLISDSPQAFEKNLIYDHENTDFLLGPSFSILAGKPKGQPFLSRVSNQVRVLITYGASDPTEESLKVINSIISWRNISAFPYPIVVEIIVGPYFKNSSELRDLCKEAGIRVYNSPASIQGYLKRADIVFTSGGNTMIEALSYCSKTIVTITDPNQSSLTDYLSRKGLIVCLGKSEQIGGEILPKSLSKIFQNIDHFINNILNESPFDGKGTERIYDQLFGEKN